MRALTPSKTYPVSPWPRPGLAQKRLWEGLGELWEGLEELWESSGRLIAWSIYKM